MFFPVNLQQVIMMVVPRVSGWQSCGCGLESMPPGNENTEGPLGTDVREGRARCPCRCHQVQESGCNFGRGGCELEVGARFGKEVGKKGHQIPERGQEEGERGPHGTPEDGGGQVGHQRSS